ncbi:MAG TPA: diacylglycerol kinase family lipid kinase [Caldilineaceae bacterium]|nr:diacylglycerol kinase family lipid kinase [Caldilineaceae bacterium]
MSASPLQTERILVILNPYSGRGRGARIKSTVQTTLSAAGLTHDYIETKAQGQGVELAQQAVEDGYSILVAVGGDGTVNEVVNGLMRGLPAVSSSPKLGIVSVGSGNDFANTMGIAQDAVQAVQAIRHGVTRPCDLGHVVIHTAGERIERYFSNNFGIGLDPQVTLESFKIKRLSGLAMYGLAALRAIWNYEAPTMRLRWENGSGESGEWHEPLLLASIGNTPRSGGGFHLTPRACVDDGLLDLVMAANMPRWQVLRLLPKAIPGRHLGDPAVTAVQARTVQISADQPFPLEMDGEVITQAAETVEITVQPGKLVVIV